MRIFSKIFNFYLPVKLVFHFWSW